MFLRFSHGFPMILPLKIVVSYGFPMVSLWFSPMTSLVVFFFCHGASADARSELVGFQSGGRRRGDQGETQGDRRWLKLSRVDEKPLVTMVFMMVSMMVFYDGFVDG